MKLVRLSPYDPSWPRRYEEEAPKVATALESTVVGIEHIGSTAVPGLEAKPTIDILAGARSLEVGEEATTRMEGLGYELRGELGVPGRRYFRKGSSFPREFNVHVVVFGGHLWRQNIDFRDYLRAHPETAEAYMALKRELVATPQGAELENYAAGKAGFIAEVLEAARRRSRG